MLNPELEEELGRRWRDLLAGSANDDAEALRNPIASHRFRVLGVERIDDVTLRITVRFAQIPEFIAPNVESADTRVAILSSLVDDEGNLVITQAPDVDLEEFISTARIDEETIVGTEPDGTVVVDGRSEL